MRNFEFFSRKEKSGFMKYEITKEELETIEAYKNGDYVAINQLLEKDVEAQIAMLARRK